MTLTDNRRFWTISILCVIGYAALFILTNRINNLDELHYLSLAFEMHRQHYYLLPMALGHPDIQKPPLLYWLINLGWAVFGISTTWPLMLIALINLGCLFCTWRIAQKLFPENGLVAQLSVVILATSVFWFHFFSRIRFDGLLTLFSVMYISIAINMYRQHQFKWTAFSGLILGLGFLAKGAAILVFVLPFYLLLPVYEKQEYSYAKWLGHFALSFIISLAVVALWAVPLYLSLGRVLMDTMFVKQQHSRILLTHHLGELPNLLASFLPWTVLPLLLINLSRVVTDKINKHFWLLALNVVLPGLFFTFFVLMHVKRYLLPLYPFFAIMLAYIISLRINSKTLTVQNRILALLFTLLGFGFICLTPIHAIAKFLPTSHDYAILGITLIVAAMIGHYFNKNPAIHVKLSTLIGFIVTGLVIGIAGVNGIFTRTNDVFYEKLTLQMKHNQERGIPQANLISGGYQAFDFKGQLSAPLPLFNENSREFKAWLAVHPNGILYFSSRKHVRSCMAAHSFHLKGSDRIISTITVSDYLANC